MSECCSEHPGVFVLGCWQGTLRAIDAAREQYDDPLERLIYVTERIGGLDRYDWPMIARPPAVRRPRATTIVAPA